ncbi:hypothetical protein [Helicobacter sp. UBA3407]|uniref:hypothetical protein n=1 Tax=Helicobacter sp. UBA3407 TaxID=1946588 RepID=UPI002619AE54|nr:hypothetical protein [Helicobacter sp. UBA3407]
MNLSFRVVGWDKHILAIWRDILTCCELARISSPYFKISLISARDSICKSNTKINMRLCRGSDSLLIFTKKIDRNLL